VTAAFTTSAQQRLCTVADRRRLAQALVLAESFLRHHPDGEAHVVVADAEHESELPSPGSIRLSTGHAVAGDAFGRLAGALPATELAEALIPYALSAVGPPAMYLAPDAWVLARLELPAGDALVVTRGAGEPPVFDPGFAAVRGGPLLDWWRDREEALRPDGGSWADAAVGTVTGVVPVTDDGLAVARWNAAARRLRREGDRLVAGVDRIVRWMRFDGFRPEAPHALAGVDLEALPALREELEAYAERVVDLLHNHGCVPDPGFRLAADGTPLDARLRRLYARGVREGALTKGPFTRPGWGAFTRWLRDPDPSPMAGGVSRYLLDLHRERGDLQRAYPDLRDPVVRDGFYGWVRAHGVAEHGLVPTLVPPAPRSTSRHHGPPWGVNVAGYFRSELGVGEAARRLVEAMDSALIPVLPVQGSIDPPSRRGEDYGSASPASAPFPVNLICVNADGLPAFAADVGREFFGGRYSIGYWWWELAEFPAEYHGAFGLVDEVWVGSRHALDAIGRTAPVPVIHVPLPVRVPRPERRSRRALGLPEGFVFLVTFDYNSVFARKNPLGAVDAFARAFPGGAGASLVVKSVNANRDPESHRRLVAATASHPDVHVVDRYVSTGELDAMLAACDAYVSLHRAEGFGLGLAEAMALGKPVIATGYSGNLDYMDESSAWLLPFSTVPVGEGAEPYPADAEWAEPDVDAAAAAMRSVFDDPAEARARGRRAAERIRSRHSPEAAGAAIAARLELIRPRAEDRARGGADHVPQAVQALLAPSRERAAVGPEDYAGGTARGRRLARQALLRAGRPVTANQQAIDQAILEAVERVALHDEERHLEQLALYSAVLQRSRRQDSRLAELADALTQTQRRLEALGSPDRLDAELAELRKELRPLSYGARAIPYLAGEPFTTFSHPVAGEVLGFREPPPQTPPEDRYRMFEETFRGPRERVAALVQPYLPLLDGHGPVLDIGCGRGELLGALRDAGIEASGVDMDAGMAAQARAAGLEVVIADATSHLRGLDEGGLGAITAIHVIEHLEAGDLEELMALAATRLRPGGLFVAETVNPHAGHALKTFWVDRTHRPPVFPEVALTLAATAGFGSAFVMHPRGERVVERDRFVQDAYALVAER
jgi:glycosyltransferase involved in cell wall biosynthesis/SAM-dependent methyltransferase